MQQRIVWQAVEEPAIEYVTVDERVDGSSVESTVVGLLDGKPFTVHYAIDCDQAWRVRRLRAEATNGMARIDLTADGQGTWQTGSPHLDAELSGCIDVDIIVTPFTNTLPIRRTGLHVGDSVELDVAYVTVPSLEVSKVRQRYMRLAEREWRYESLHEGASVFAADLEVDEHGLVIDYPGLFRRLYPVRG